MKQLALPNPGQFRPANLDDFKQYAADLGHLLELPVQASQALLARIYGYADYHDLRKALAAAGDPSAYDDRMDLAVPHELTTMLGYIHDLPRSLLEIVNPTIASRLLRMDKCIRSDATLKRRKHGVDHIAACVAGFFSSPRSHRAAMHRLAARATPLAQAQVCEMELRWYVAKSLDLSRGMDLSSHGQKSATRPGDQSEPLAFDPMGPIRSVAFRQAAEILALCFDSPEPLHPWVEEWDANRDEWKGADEPLWLQHLLVGAADASEEILAALRPCIAEAPDPRTDPDGFDRWNRSLSDFLLNPDPHGSIHPVFRLTPDPCAFVKDWQRRRFLRTVQNWRVLEDDVYLGKPISLGGVDYGCHVHIMEPTRLDHDRTFGPVRVNEYHAQFYRTLQGRSRPQYIGAMKGYMLSSADGQRRVSTDNDVEIACWGYEGNLPEVWKLLQFEWAQDQGTRSYTRALMKRLKHSDRDAVLLINNLFIVPEMRRQHLVGPMLQCFDNAIAEGDRVSQLTTPHWQPNNRTIRYTCGFDGVEWNAVAGHRLRAPHLYLAAVEGTMPKGYDPMIEDKRPYRGKSCKISVPLKDQDPEAEARKRKLTAHFRALTVPESEVMVYDPYDYPNSMG